MLISSTQNQKIKFIQKLEKNSFRREQEVFVIEGYREIQLALGAGYQFVQYFYCQELESKNDIDSLVKQFDSSVENYEVTKEVFEKIAYRENSDGILVLAKSKTHELNELELPENPLILILEAVEKPGNLGAILRSCDAAKVDAVIVCDTLTDVYNPNAVRSSIGCLFTNNLAIASNFDTLDFLNNKNIKPFAAALTAEKFYHQTDFNRPTAIVMGTEATGLSDFWLKNAEQIKIPMLGKIDSLNVSTSAAVLIFEAKRQRGF